jgi:hypothetical protein
MMRGGRALGARRQRGIGAVIVVMVLFFAVSLMAAYTNRNMIFEQKTSANQARASTAFESADAGIEWSLAQLNGGKIDNNCADVTPTLSFQQRYLSIDANGYVTHTARGGVDSWPTCVFNGTDWSCACPNTTAVSATAPTGAGLHPAFRVWPASKEVLGSTSSPYDTVTFTRPGLFSLGSAGCTRLPASTADTCLDFLPRGAMGDGLSSTRVVVALRSGLAVPPATPLTARGTVSPDTAVAAVKLRVANTDTGSGGYTVNSGGAVNQAAFTAETVPGTPGELSFLGGDTRLLELGTTAPTGSGTATMPVLTAGERMFVSMFGVKRDVYKRQPGVRICTSPCSASSIATLLADNPNRIIWVEGNLTLNASIGDVGASQPVLLIVDGDTLQLDNGLTIYGFVYLTGGTSATATVRLPAATGTTVRGALVAEGNLATLYTATPSVGQELLMTYDRAAMDLLRNTYGSWVRLGGGWRDFKGN